MLKVDAVIVGDKSHFALESMVDTYHQERSLMGIGYFLIHLNGYKYGVLQSNATALANSFDNVVRRIQNRGKHLAPFAEQADPNEVAQAFRDALYSGDSTSSHYFGLPESEFSDLFYTNNLIMAPDGDAAFDDSSYILQFDVGDKVRIIGFQCKETDAPSPESIMDVWMEADDFYAVLGQWETQFFNEWKKHIKLCPDFSVSPSR